MANQAASAQNAPQESDIVELDPDMLSEVINGLNAKRALVEKELISFGKAPKGIKDIFHQCRNFERAYARALEDPEVTGRIRKVFASEEGLTGLVKLLPLDTRFQLDNVKAVCREADGYQRHLVSPESGLRRLIEESMILIADPIITAVHRIHLLLVESARAASRNASKYTEDGRIDEKRTTQFPAFDRAVLAYANTCLDGWRDEAIDVAKQLVEMEEDFVTAAFFRHAMMQRSEHLRQLEDMQQIEEGAGMKPADDDDDESEEDDDDDDDDDDASDATDDKPQPKPVAAPRAAQTMPSKAPGDDDFKMGYLDKRIGENSTRQNLPEGWKWQKRWFVFTDTKGMLYYFKTADDPPNYRGLIDIKQCRVEQMDEQGNTARPGRTLQGPSQLLKISHKDPSKAAVKKHQSLVIRAETPAEMMQWYRRLKACADGPGSLRGPPSRPQMASTGGGASARRTDTAPAEQTYGGGYEGHLMPENNDSFMDGKRGLGLAIPEDATAKLGPLPVLFGQPANPDDPDSHDASSYDTFLEQLAEDTKQYVLAVFTTLQATVPKAIIHAQVKMSQEHLLEKLYNYVTGLKPVELEGLLDENPDIVQLRAAAQMSVKDITSSIVEVKRIEERRGRTPHEERPAKEGVSRTSIEQAGLWDLLPGGRSEASPSSPYGQYTPRSMQRNTPFTASRQVPGQSNGSGSYQKQPQQSMPPQQQRMPVPQQQARQLSPQQQQMLQQQQQQQQQQPQRRPSSSGGSVTGNSALTGKPRRRPPPPAPPQ